jgi:hypothetical protein
MTCDCIESGKPLEGNTGHTASCNHAQRKAERLLNKPIKAPNKIAKTSDKMKEALKEYSKLRKQFLAAHPKCAVYPERPATNIHHMAGRNTMELLLDTDKWLAVSFEGHSRIELNPLWAKANGFSLSRLATYDGPKFNYGIIDEFKEPHKI